MGATGDDSLSQSSPPRSASRNKAFPIEALAGVAKNRGEIVVTRHAKGMVTLQKFAPWVLRSLAKQGMRRS